MGNSLGCSATGERLVSAARDGDAVEVRMLLALSPALARYATFRGLNTPLHFAAAMAHNEIVTMLLEAGADVNARNYCGQTALMHACRRGRWEVVQTLLLFRCNVTKADYMTGRTALHFAVSNGHIRCVRLLLADFVPSLPRVGTVSSQELCSDTALDVEGIGGSSPKLTSAQIFDPSARLRFINKPADGGVTAIHMAALGGDFNCLQLLLDVGANASAVTFPYGSENCNIGAGSTPLHYAASSGSLGCCQILLSRGASRMTLNFNGWLPVDVARIWGRHWLEPLLEPDSSSAIPTFPPSNNLSLALSSILNIARQYGIQRSVVSSADSDLCAVCLERVCSVAGDGCRHQLCIKCALYLCSTSNAPAGTAPPGSTPCPFCRNGITSFRKLPGDQDEGLKFTPQKSLCSPCIPHTRPVDSSGTACKPETSRSCIATVSPEQICPITCNPFPSSTLPTFRCNDDSCEDEDDEEAQAQSPRASHSTTAEECMVDEQGRDQVSCAMFWGRRSCQREHQCNAEINA